MLSDWVSFLVYLNLFEIKDVVVVVVDVFKEINKKNSWIGVSINVGFYQRWEVLIWMCVLKYQSFFCQAQVTREHQ
jgi:hypothetical protein